MSFKVRRRSTRRERTVLIRSARARPEVFPILLIRVTRIRCRSRWWSRSRMVPRRRLLSRCFIRRRRVRFWLLIARSRAVRRWWTTCRLLRWTRSRYGRVLVPLRIFRWSRTCSVLIFHRIRPRGWTRLLFHGSGTVPVILSSGWRQLLRFGRV